MVHLISFYYLGFFTLGFGYLLWAPGAMAGISYAVGVIRAGVSAISTVVGIETEALINLAKTKKMIKIIQGSVDGEGKVFEHFAKRLQADFPYPVSVKQIRDVIINANNMKLLCDASIVNPRKQRKYKRKGSLRFRLASKKELEKYINKIL